MHLGAPQRGRVKFPQWGCVHRYSFPVLSLGTDFSADDPRIRITDNCLVAVMEEEYAL